MGKVENVIRFYYLATDLKYKIRSAWDDVHWGILGDRRESVAEHSFGTCILAIGIASEFDLDIDMNKVIKMLSIHEIGEVLIPDYTPFDNITPEEKARIEHIAMREVLGKLDDSEELYALLLEFDEKKTDEAKFAFLCDKLELVLQAKSYQDKGLQRDLSDQEGNIVMGFTSIIKMIENGAKNAFEVFYENDEAKFEHDPVFQELFSYIKDHSVDVEGIKEDFKKRMSQ